MTLLKVNVIKINFHSGTEIRPTIREGMLQTPTKAGRATGEGTTDCGTIRRGLCCTIPLPSRKNHHLQQTSMIWNNKYKSSYYYFYHYYTIYYFNTPTSTEQGQPCQASGSNELCQASQPLTSGHCSFRRDNENRQKASIKHVNLMRLFRIFFWSSLQSTVTDSCLEHSSPDTGSNTYVFCFQISKFKSCSLCPRCCTNSSGWRVCGGLPL